MKLGRAWVACLLFPSLLPRTSSLDQTSLLITWTSHSPCLPPNSRLQFPASPQNYSNKPISFSCGKWGYLTFLVLPARIFGLPRSIEIDQRPDKKFRQGFIGAPTASEGGKNKEQFPLLFCSPRWGRAGSLCKVRVWGPRGWAGGVPTPLTVLNTRAMHSTLLLLLTS